MSSFTPEDVRRLASLARLQLSPEEVTSFARQLGEILEFARQVQSADASAAEAILPPSPAMRHDVVEPSLPRDIVLAGAPDADREAGVFKVPRVFNG
jgi:aspartyl-tRNA(Asn)/glutamyl-tRNA(Gln) amidotransferase subunit C